MDATAILVGYQRTSMARAARKACVGESDETKWEFNPLALVSAFGY